MASVSGPGREPGGSLVHGLRILSMFTPTHRVLGVADMARGLDVHRSTASRLAASLAAYGYLVPADEPGRYRLGHALVPLGEIAATELDLTATGVAALKEAVEESGETAHLAVLDGQQAVSVAIVDGWHTIRMHSWVGKASPPHCTSTGKVLLAGLDADALRELYPGGSSDLERRTPHTLRTLTALRADLEAVRQRGYAIDDEELELGLRCVGAPVFDRLGRVVASVSLSGPAVRVRDDAVTTLGSVVVRAGHRASVALGCPADRAHWGPELPS
jgi:DNA-binding IclR family transcriptional regulator